MENTEKVFKYKLNKTGTMNHKILFIVIKIYMIFKNHLI